MRLNERSATGGLAVAEQNGTTAEVHLIGGGGHASVIADAARSAGAERITVWADDAPALARFPSGATAGRLADLDPETPVIIALGDLDLRRKMRARFPNPAPPVIHPDATIASGVRVEPGAVIFARCVVNPNAMIGRDAILNTACVVEHDCVVGENTHISPGAILAGAVQLGAHVHVGAGAVVIPGRRVGDRAVVGAGAVVIHDVPAGVTVVGVPAASVGRSSGSSSGHQRTSMPG